MSQSPKEYWYDATGNLVACGDPGAMYAAYMKGTQIAASLVPAADKPPAATLTSINPTTAPIASSGLIVTLTGTGFNSSCVVLVGGVVTSPAACRSSTTMEVVIKAAAPGVIPITVKGDFGRTSAAVSFTFT